MKKFLIIFFIVIMAVPAFCFTNWLDFGVNYYKFDYREILAPPLKSTENAMLPQIDIGYGFSTNNSNAVNLSFHFLDSPTKYDGSLQDGTPYVGTTYNVMYDTIATYGQTFKNLFWLPFNETIYAGIGHHFWKRDVGYVENYSWYYFPVGLKITKKINSFFTIGTNFGVKWMKYGKMDVILKGRTINNKVVKNDPTLILGNRRSYFIKLIAKFKIDKQWTVLVEPWYDYSEIGQSNKVALYEADNTYITHIYEPSSITRQYGIKLSYIYSLPNNIF